MARSKMARTTREALTMPFDLIGFSEAAPGNAAGGNLIAAGLIDSLYRASGDDIFIKKGLNWLLGVMYAAESTPGRVEVKQASMGSLPYEFVRALDLNDADPIGGFTDLRYRPMPLFEDEKLNAYSFNATDEDTLVGLMVGSGRFDRKDVEAVIPTHRIRGYADQTLTANSWTLCSITWDHSLPKGDYAIVGCEIGSYISSGFMAALGRLILKGEVPYRPGVPVTQLAGDKVTFDSISHHPYSKWPIMKEIKLNYNLMPDIEILSPAALTDHIVELELVQLTRG